MEAVLPSMLRSLEHRGPDDRGESVVYSGDRGKAGFVHTRLAILDLSAAGHQPMREPGTGNVITFNGEIYNFRQVRARLDAAGSGDWASTSDTEVILKAYGRWEEASLEELRGMFAFAIWDASREELFLARDRVGIKPLYYYSGEGCFLFASEVRALLATGLVPRKIDEVGLWEYLGYQAVPAPRTLIDGVRMLRPGHWMRVDMAGQITEARYWDALENARSEGAGADESRVRARVGELLRESVSMHLVSDVPVAAFLSGGIDSSAVAVLMREAGQTPRTFSIVFSESAYDEAKYARRIAEQIQAEHTEIHLKEEDLLARLPEALGSMDQPTGDGVNTYIVSRAVRDAGVKVALSGLGGDEIFAGYSSFARLDRAAPYLRMLGTVPEGGRAIAARAVRALGGATIAAAKTAAILETDGSISSVFPTLRQVLSVPQRRALLTDRLRLQGDAAPDPYVALLQRALTKTDAGVLTQVSYAESMTYMHDVLLRDTDQMSMAHALEVRVPLLDHKLIEYVMGVPDSLKRSNGTPKRLLVESLGALLPPEIVHRPKRGFTLPFDVWMRGAMRQFCEQRLDRDRTRGRGIFNPNEVWRLWTAFLDGSRSVSWSRLWILIVLEEWLDTNGISSSLARQRVEREDENG